MYKHMNFLNKHTHIYIERQREIKTLIIKWKDLSVWCMTMQVLCVPSAAQRCKTLSL